jgi:predicted lipid-binding transport protein (Tim44 family)
MNFDGPGMGFNPFVQFFVTALTGVAFLVSFAIIAGLIFLLVRFLLVATQAAQIYVAQNRPAEPVAPAAASPAPAATPAAAPAATPAAAPAKPTPAATKPAPVTKPSSPKTPPAV